MKCEVEISAALNDAVVEQLSFFALFCITTVLIVQVRTVYTTCTYVLYISITGRLIDLTSFFLSLVESTLLNFWLLDTEDLLDSLW